MDKYEHSTRQYKTTDTSPELRKAQCDISRALDLLAVKSCSVETHTELLYVYSRLCTNGFS